MEKAGFLPESLVDFVLISGRLDAEEVWTKEQSVVQSTLVTVSGPARGASLVYHRKSRQGLLQLPPHRAIGRSHGLRSSSKRVSNIQRSCREPAWAVAAVVAENTGRSQHTFLRPAGDEGQQTAADQQEQGGRPHGVCCSRLSGM
jgi:hypothetical protein